MCRGEGCDRGFDDRAQLGELVQEIGLCLPTPTTSNSTLRGREGSSSIPAERSYRLSAQFGQNLWPQESLPPLEPHSGRLQIDAPISGSVGKVCIRFPNPADDIASQSGDEPVDDADGSCFATRSWSSNASFLDWSELAIGGISCGKLRWLISLIPCKAENLAGVRSSDVSGYFIPAAAMTPWVTRFWKMR